MFAVKIAGRDPYDHDQHTCFLIVRLYDESQVMEMCKDTLHNHYEREIQIEKVDPSLPVQNLFCD